MHTQLFHYREKVAEYETQISQLKDQNESLKKSSQLLHDSLGHLTCTKEALREPINFELEYINVV